MPRYDISGVIAADRHLGEVEAASAQEAIARAWDELECSAPPLCHHCAHQLNLGDVYKLVAQNVEDDKDHAEGE